MVRRNTWCGRNGQVKIVWWCTRRPGSINRACSGQVLYVRKIVFLWGKSINCLIRNKRTRLGLDYLFLDHATMLRRRWSDDLSLDLLREIAACLHIAADFIHFHAICRPWRNSRNLDDKTVVNQFLPWLLASAGNQHFPPQQGATSVRVAPFLRELHLSMRKAQLVSKLHITPRKVNSFPSCNFSSRNVKLVSQVAPFS
jgi:hypothetical protein